MPAPRHIDFIDGLRAVAVLAVVAFHLEPSVLPGGFVGVDVFFVISGFVVSGSLAGQSGRSLKDYLAHFYARRLRRIVPALLVCLLVTGLATTLFVPSAWLSDANEQTGLMAFFGLSNFELLAASGDYFSPQTELNPYTHTWSLGVEEQFYAIFPLLFFVWARRPRLAAALLAVTAAASLGYAAARTGQAASFYLLSGRFWELGAGALLFQLTAGRAPLTRAAQPASAAACLLLAAGLLLARDGRTPFPDALPAVLGTLGLLAFLPGTPRANPIRWMLESRSAVSIGKVSYSLYLWHWPVFVLFRWTVGLDTLVTAGAALAVTAGAATASYRLVEQPFRYSPAIQRAPRYAVVALTLLFVVAGSRLHGAITERQPQLSLSVLAEAPADWYTTWNGDTRCPAATAPRHGGSVTTFTPAACGAAQGGGRLFAIGDSHAIMYEPMLREAAMRTGRELALYSKAGCAVFALGPVGDSSCSRRYAQAALRDIGRVARRGDVLFLPSLRMPRLSEQWGRAKVSRAIASADDAERETWLSLSPLARRGVRVLFEGPLPVFRAPAFRCVDWFNRGSRMCRDALEIERATIAALRAPVLAAYGRLATQLAHASVWDPLPVLCPNRRCTAMRDGRPLFFDGDHLSRYGNQLLVPSFLEHLRADAGLPQKAAA